MRYYRLQNGRLTSDRARVERELERVARRAPCGYADAKVFEANAPSAVHVACDVIEDALPFFDSPHDARVIQHESTQRHTDETIRLRAAAEKALGAYIAAAYPEVVPREEDQDPILLLRVWPDGTSEVVPLDDEGPEDDDNEVAP